MTTLVTGSTGPIGSRVVANLVAAKADVRALVRRPDAANLSGARLVIGDFADEASLRAALDGVDAVFLLTPPHPDEVAMVERFLGAAVATSPQPRIIRLSGLKATEGGPSESIRGHARADRAIIESGLPYAILRPNYFMQNMLSMAGSARDQGTFYNSTGDRRIGFIDTRDIADVASAVLLDPSWDRGIYDLTGPEAVSFPDVVRTIEAEMGRALTRVDITAQQAGAAVLQQGAGKWFADLIEHYSIAYGDGWGDFTSQLVEKITGRPPRSIADFARDVFVPALSDR